MSKNDPTTKKRRGRPARSPDDVREMRARISACALRLFEEEGYHAVSMRRLASEVGCTVMTLYNYYDRKFEILMDLWGQIFAELFQDLQEIASKKRSPESRLKAISLAYVEYWLERREHYFLVFMSAEVTQSDVGGFVEMQGAITGFEIFETAISQISNKQPDCGETLVKSQALICMLNGIAHNLITISSVSWASPPKLVNTALQGVLHD